MTTPDSRDKFLALNGEYACASYLAIKHFIGSSNGEAGKLTAGFRLLELLSACTRRAGNRRRAKQWYMLPTKNERRPKRTTLSAP